jgi:hypothetical protein
MKCAYDAGMSPPGLLLPATVGPLERDAFSHVTMKLDTGADITAIPQDVLVALAVKPEGRILVRGPFDRDVEERPTYFVNLRITDKILHEVEVLATPKEHGLLGRDVLNQYVLHADGPRLVFEIGSDPGDEVISD